MLELITNNIDDQIIIISFKFITITTNSCRKDENIMVYALPGKI